MSGLALPTSSHTAKEILQQPELWRVTAERMARGANRWAAPVRRSRAVALTGSGSSEFVAACAQAGVQRGLGKTAVAVGSGEALLRVKDVLPVERPLLVVSFARSGNSPESYGVVKTLLDQDDAIEHLILTCNPEGRVVSQWAAGHPRVVVETLDERSCDKSLVMTSSFTCLALAGLSLGYLDRPSEYLAGSAAAADIAEEVLGRWAERIEELARRPFSRMIALGSGPQFGAAREAALKMLEMTDGRVVTFAETALGFRHGPMCALRDDALLLAFLSADATIRAYQLDLLREIRRKNLGNAVIAVGPDPAVDKLLGDEDLAVTIPQLGELPDDFAALTNVVVGQLLGFFRCLEEGLSPDQPAETGAISRVVSDFTIHQSK